MTRRPMLVDLGDVFTKVRIAGVGKGKPLRYPSVVARRLLDPGAGASSLVLGDDVVRPVDFEAARFPRARSYAGTGRALRATAAGARYAGWIAAACGEDRVTLGQQPTAANIDALVHKALFSLPEGVTEVDITYVIDLGPKAAAISDYAGPARTARFQVRTVDGRTARPRTVVMRGTTVDAVACAVAALPPILAVDRVGRLLVADIGYHRTKLAIVSQQGCEHQHQLEGLGTRDCVRRVLRDGQDEGLVEDELAVAVALERDRDAVEIQGRRFDVARPRRRAERALVQELARGIERAIVEHQERTGEPCRAVALAGGGAAAFEHQERTGEPCRAVALAGGGAAAFGSALARALRAAGLGLVVEAIEPAGLHLLRGAAALGRLAR